jgi:hypothetical protein
MSRLRLSRNLHLPLALIAVAALYILLLGTLLPLNSFWSGDQGAKLVQVLSLLRSRFTETAIPYPGLTIDPARQFTPQPALYTWPRDGVYYSIFSYPYAALTAIPFFGLGYAGLYVIPVLATLATFTVSAFTARHLGLPGWRISPVLLALATPLSFYALVFWEHSLATGLAAAATLAGIYAIEAGERRIGWAVVAGILTGSATWFRAETLWLGPALLAGLLIVRADYRLILAALAGVGAAVGIMLIFNTILIGLPLGPQIALNYQDRLTDIGGLLQARLQIAGVMLIGLAYRVAYWIAAAVTALVLAIVPDRRKPWILLILALIIFGGLLATQPRDLDWTALTNTCPLALLALGAWRFPDRRIRFLTIVAVVYTIGVLLSAPNAGGAQWGPRYLLPIVPALLILAWRVAHELTKPGAPARRPALIALIILVLSSIGIQARGIELLSDSYARNLRIIQVTNARPMHLIVTDALFGPQVLAPLYFERPILFVSESAKWPALSQLLAEQGVNEFVYLTDIPRDDAPVKLQPLGMTCRLVEGLSHGMSLFDCQVAPRAGHRPMAMGETQNLASLPWPMASSWLYPSCRRFRLCYDNSNTLVGNHCLL